MKVFAGNSNRLLAEAICNYSTAGLGQSHSRRFADQKSSSRSRDVRGEDVFHRPVDLLPTNDHLMELLIMIDAVRRSSARRINAVLLFRLCRQIETRSSHGRSPPSWSPISITEAGADRVLTLDLHAGQIQGFFDIPTDTSMPFRSCARRQENTISRRHGRFGRMFGGVVRAGARQRLDCPAGDRRQASRRPA